MAYMKLRVEIAVFSPVRMVQAEWHFGKCIHERRHLHYSSRGVGNDLLKGYVSAGGR